MVLKKIVEFMKSYPTQETIKYKQLQLKHYPTLMFETYLKYNIQFIENYNNIIFPIFYNKNRDNRKLTEIVTNFWRNLACLFLLASTRTSRCNNRNRT